jgi:hypothetical protein
MSFKSEYSGQVVSPSGSDLNIRTTPSISAKVLTNVKAACGKLSGTYFNMTNEPGKEWFQVILYKPVNGATYGYVRRDVFKMSKGTTDKATDNAQNLINDFIKSDLEIFKSLAVSARLIQALNAKGIDTSKQVSTLKYLGSNLYLRQKALIDAAAMFSKTQKGVPPGYESLQKDFNDIMKGANIGIVPIIVYFIIVAVISVGSTIAAYYLFKPKYDDSTVDLKTSKELEKALSTLSPEEQERVKADLEKQIDKAYNQGKTDQNLSTSYGWVNTLVFIAAGAYLADKFLSRKNG